MTTERKTEKMIKVICLGGKFRSVHYIINIICINLWQYETKHKQTSVT